jgi:pimeloyl-ACP methyl ester carboxylesterase
MIATVLILDLFDQIEFWKNIQEIDLVYGVLDFVSHPRGDASNTKHQDITIPTIAIDLFDQIITKGFLKFNFIANGVPASLVALQLASLLRGRDDLELCKMCLIGGSFVPPSRGFLMQSLYHVKNPRDFLGLFLSPDYLSKQDSKPSSLEESSFSKSFLEDSFSARNHADCRLDQIADAIQEFSMPFEQIQLLTSIPLLLLHGEIDKMVDMSFSVALHDQWQNSEIHIFPRAGHWIHIENSQKVMTLIRKWGIST